MKLAVEEFELLHTPAASAHQSFETVRTKLV